MKIQTTPIFSKIQKAYEEGYTTISLQGSSRSSKTYNTLIWLIFFCVNHPRTRLSIVRATLPALKGSVFVDFKEILCNMGLYNEKALNKSELVYTFSNGSWVEFFSCDKEQKLRGRKRDILFVNEANELSFIEWQQLKMRTTKLAILDYNPSFTEEHWICTINEEPKTFHFISTYKENPFLEQAIVDEIESLQKKNKSLWQIYGLGQRAVIEGLIFKNTEVINEMPSNLKHYWIGMDLGFTNDPTAITLVGYDGESLYLQEICYQTQMLTNDIIRVLKGYSSLEVISESADPRLIQEVYRAGINIHPVKKFQGSIEAGISKMQELKIKITRLSTNVKKEFSNYVYQQDKEGKWLNSPIDAYNHAIDGIRYVVLERIIGGERRHLSSKQWEDLAF